MKHLKNVFLFLFLAFSQNCLFSITESQESNDPNIQATFESNEAIAIIEGVPQGRGCFFTDGQLNLSARWGMRGDVVIQNKLNEQVQLINLDNTSKYFTLEPGQSHRFVFDDKFNRITAVKRDSTGKFNSYTINISDWIWVKFCKVNYASFGPAGPSGSNQLGMN